VDVGYLKTMRLKKKEVEKKKRRKKEKEKKEEEEKEIKKKKKNTHIIHTHAQTQFFVCFLVHLNLVE